MIGRHINALCLFDYNAFTGFGTVSKNLVQQWKQIFKDEITFNIVAVNYFGKDYQEPDGTRVSSAMNNDPDKNIYGMKFFLKTLDENDYDFVFVLLDPATVSSMGTLLETIKERKTAAGKPPFKSILYFPVDGVVMKKHTVGIEAFDKLFTYTEYGKNEVLLARPDLKEKLGVINHGVDVDNYFPIPEGSKQLIRKKFFLDNADKFIICNINRNQPRKDIPTTIFAFMEYKETYNENAFLYLHMNPNDPLGWNLREVLSQTPLVEGKDFCFPSKEIYEKGASIEQMNSIYNSCDVFLSTATGGGWELSVTEAMACRIPVIIPKHTSFKYLGGEHGQRAWFIEELYPVCHNVDNIIRFQSDLYEIASTLDIIYKDIAEKHSLQTDLKTKAAFEFTRQIEWKRIAHKFANEMVDLLKCDTVTV